MNGEESETKDTAEDDSSEDALTETVVLSEVDGDTIADLSIESSIEKLVTELEASDNDDVHHRAEIRRKLEELREMRDMQLDSTYNINLDDD